MRCAPRAGKAETPQSGSSGFQLWKIPAAPLSIARTCKCPLWEGKESCSEVPAGRRTPGCAGAESQERPDGCRPPLARILRQLTLTHPEWPLSILSGLSFRPLPGTERRQAPSDFTISSYFPGPRKKGLCVGRRVRW